MNVLPPGSTLGVLGNGQLGRMFAMAAERLGYKVIGFGPDADSPLSQVCSKVHCASYDDGAALAAFAHEADAVTIEFENIPSRALELVAQHKPVYPEANVLHICQHRLHEKEFLSSNGFPVTPYAVLMPAQHMPEQSQHPTSAHQVQTLADAVAITGLPAVFKTTGFGYDGKGQRLVRDIKQAERAIADLTSAGVAPARTTAAAARGSGAQVIIEQLVDFEKEVSVIGARTQDNQFAAYGPIENKHANHILDVSCLPARMPPQLSAQAIEITRAIMERLDVIGLLCVEFFVTTGGALLVNELAPRPHNSGHLTIEGCATSQFEQLARIVCGLPLGDTAPLRPSAMANLLGDLWLQCSAVQQQVADAARSESKPNESLHGQPQWSRVLSLPSAHLHLYGKTQAKPGRKMGHITACADTIDEAITTVAQARSLLAQQTTSRDYVPQRP